MDSTDYRKIFKEIVDGYTKTQIDDQTYYIKHLSALDQVDIDEVRSQYLKKALSRGIPSEKEVLGPIPSGSTATSS